jgi:hypothetical protein
MALFLAIPGNDIPTIRTLLHRNCPLSARLTKVLCHFWNLFAEGVDLFRGTSRKES